VFVFETVLDMFPKRFSCVSPDCRSSMTMLSGVLLEVFSMFMRRGIKYRRGGGFYVYDLDLCVISCRRIVLARVISIVVVVDSWYVVGYVVESVLDIVNAVVS